MKRNNTIIGSNFLLREIADKYYIYDVIVKERKELLKNPDLSDEERIEHEITLQEAEILLSDIQAVYELLVERQKQRNGQ